jgi:hypothetical protein
MTEFGDFFHCKRDGKIIPKSMRCIYAVDNSGYMTGCRSGDHLQNCGNKNIYLVISMLSDIEMKTILNLLNKHCSCA